MKSFVLTLSCILFAVTSFAQDIPEVYQLGRTKDAYICHLPTIYFKTQSAEIEPVNLEDLAYLADMMKRYKKLKVKVEPEITPDPYDAKYKLLTEERLNYITWLLDDKYDIDPDRIVRDGYKELSRGYEPAPAALALDLRRVTCDCVWK